MVVAEADGDIVGAEPCLVFRLHVGDETALAFQPADWMVHPDHRKQGLFTRMTERLLERYADGPADLYYNLPTEAIIPGLRNFDWRVAGALSTHYRLQDPLAVAANTFSGKRSATSLALALGHTVDPLARGLLSFRDSIIGAGDGWTVDRHDRVPVDTLVRLYRSGIPDDIHVHRDAEFYGWRFENPLWEARTYVARDDDGPAGSLITITTDHDGVRQVWVLDAVPADGSAPEGCYEALLAAVISDSPDACVLKCAAGGIPPSVFRRLAFLADDALPLSTISKPTTIVVRPASLDGDDPWTLGGLDLADGDRWSVQFCGQDIA